MLKTMAARLDDIVAVNSHMPSDSSLLRLPVLSADELQVLEGLMSKPEHYGAYVS